MPLTMPGFRAIPYMPTWPYLAEDMVSLTEYLLDKKRPVEQTKNRLRKGYAFQNFTISAQCADRSIYPCNHSSAYSRRPIGGLRRWEGQESLPLSDDWLLFAESNLNPVTVEA